MMYKKMILAICILSMIVISCVDLPNYIEGSIENGFYKNEYLSMQIPNGWKNRGSGNHIVLMLQKIIKTADGLKFPTVIMEAGSINYNLYPTHFENSLGLAYGCLEAFKKNELYIVDDSLGLLENNGLKLYFFETRLHNQKFSIPELVQKHYYFNIDTIFFHLSLGDHDMIDELKNDYSTLINTLKPN